MSRLPRVTSGSVVRVETAGQGYFIGLSVGYEIGAAGVTILTVIDQVRVSQFVLPFRQIVRSITYEVTTGGGAGKKIGIGLYDVNGSLVVETGAQDANSVAVLRVAVTAVTLEPGIYYVAITSDSTSTAVRSITKQANNILDMINEGGAQARFGTASVGSVGVLPASMGTVTAATAKNSPYVVFAP